MSANAEAAKAPRGRGVGATLAIDYGPLLLFFLDQFLRAGAAGQTHLLGDRRVHGRDDGRDGCLAAPLPQDLADALVLRGDGA